MPAPAHAPRFGRLKADPWVVNRAREPPVAVISSSLPRRGFVWSTVVKSLGSARLSYSLVACHASCTRPPVLSLSSRSVGRTAERGVFFFCLVVKPRESNMETCLALLLCKVGWLPHVARNAIVFLPRIDVELCKKRVVAYPGHLVARPRHKTFFCPDTHTNG